MARPNVLQFLRSGKFIWPKMFPLFADTFNWVVRAVDNLRGDFDANPKEGFVWVDRTDQDAPVIRLRFDKIAKRMSPGSASTPGCFEPTVDVDLDQITFANQYYRVGGKTYEVVGIGSVSGVLGQIVALVIDVSGTSPSATFTTYSTVGEMKSAEASITTYIIPLFTVGEDGTIKCDWRKGALAAMGEF